MAPLLLGYARKILHDRARADDAVQAAMLSIFRQPKGRIREVRDVRSWLVRLVRNEALMQLRTDRRAAAREEQHVRNATVRLRREQPEHEALRDAVDALPVGLREVVVMKCVSGLTFEQMAEAMDENRNTIASRYRTAIAKLRAALEEDEDVERGAGEGPARAEGGETSQKETVSNDHA